MRDVDSALITASAQNNRYPISRIEIYDSILRWTELVDSYYDTGYPDAESVGNIPQAFVDASIVGTVAYVGWASGVLARRLTTTNLVTWANSAETATITAPHRVSIEGSHIYHYYDEDIYNNGASMAEVEDGDYALAAVASGCCYAARLNDGNIELSYYASGVSDHMDYGIPVPDDYTIESLSWFDAVRLSDGTDVITINTETYGKPVIITRKNDVYSNVRTMIPIDIVDNHSFLRIGWMKVYEGVIYATGELGRKGSTGLHPQSMAVVLRSKDGIRWSMDRWRYLGTTPLRTPLLMTDTHAYKIGVPEIYIAPLTPLFGLQDGNIMADHIKIEIEEEILSWSAMSPGSGGSGNLQIQLSDPELLFSSSGSESYIKPGYMLKLYAGYKTAAGDKEHLVNWFGVDTLPRTLAHPGKSLSVQCTEWNYRCLENNYFDQDWQWTSQLRHYDDCDKRDYLYSVGGSSIHLIDDEEKQVIIDENPISTKTGKLRVFAHKERTTLISTVPFETDGGFASVSFTVDGASEIYDDHVTSSRCNFVWRLGFNEHGVQYSLADQEIGVGAGPAIIDDEYNFITAFLDVKSRSLILLRVVGDSDSETWSEIAKHNVDALVNFFWVDDYFGSQLYEVWMNITGNTVRYGLITSETGHEWFTDAIPTYVPRADIVASPYEPNDREYYTEQDATVDRAGENRLGIIVGASNPYIRVVSQRAGDIVANSVAGRSLLEYNNGEDIETDPYYLETSAYTWESFRDIQLGRDGFAYVNSDDGKRVLLHGNDPYDGSNVPTGMRGDYCTGRWAIQAVSTSGYDVYIELDKYDCYPPGEDGDYWLDNLGAENPDVLDNMGFWFIDGDYEGLFLRANSVEAGAGDNVKFQFNTGVSPQTVLPAPGDDVVFCAMAKMSVSASYSPVGLIKVAWNNKPVGVTISSFLASDLEHEKSILWTLQDIATKAGVLDFLPALNTEVLDLSVDESFSADGYNFLDDSMASFDLEVILSSAIAAGQSFKLFFGCTTQYASAPADSENRVEVTITSDSSGVTIRTWTDSEYIDHMIMVPDGLAGKEFRFIKKDEYISIWCERRHIISYPVRLIWPDCDFDTDLISSRRVGFRSSEAGQSYTVKQAALWQRLDGVMSDQGSNASSAMSRVIRDARIKILADEGLALRISSFINRDDAGVVPDVILQESLAITDLIPSHVRTVGEEIGEYVDHDIAAEYGILFKSISVESLEEEAAYQEAIATLHDRLGEIEGSQDVHGGQIRYEPEDELEVDFEMQDGETVTRVCIVDSTGLQYSRNSLLSNTKLRKNYD